MTDIKRKKHTGETGNGGEFGSKVHADADTALVDVAPPAVWDVCLVRSSGSASEPFDGKYVYLTEELGESERDGEVGRMFVGEGLNGTSERFFENELAHVELFDLNTVRVPEDQWERNGALSPKRGSASDERCLVCNRPVADFDKAKNQASVHMSTQGELFPADMDLYEIGSSQGGFSVGSECAKKIPAQYK